MNRSDSNRILLVDNDPQVHARWRAAGFPADLEIESAYHGQEGWQHVRQALEEYRPFMLAVVNRHLADGWGGVETIRRIWDIDPELLILLCLDRPEEGSEQFAEQLGGLERVFFLTEPRVPDQLRQVVAWQLKHLQLREELHQTTLQLESAEQTIERLHNEAEQAGLAGQQVGDGLRYDMRAALHTILGLSEQMAKEHSNPDMIRRLRHVQEAGQSLLHVLTDMESQQDELRPPTADPLAAEIGAPTADNASPPSDRYLIVDDQAICRELLALMLESYGQCDLAGDGEEALEAFRRAREELRPYDLICLDIMMPGLNGHEVLERIRAMETEMGLYGSDRTRVIMTTALADSKHLLQAFRNGCEAYVVKPFTEHDILTTMHRLGLAVAAP